jgi:hypothetical protein
MAEILANREATTKSSAFPSPGIVPIIRKTAGPRNLVRSGIALTFAAFFAALALANAIVFTGVVAADSLLAKLLIEHFAAIVGLPCAAFMAFAFVWIWRLREGPIELEAWGMKFKGAAGPIVMWVLVFATLTGGLKAVW